MNTNNRSEILINATRVNHSFYDEVYEFIFDEDLQVIECIRIESLIDGIIYPVENFKSHFKKVLFEFNHVRINPALDNTDIIQKLAQRFKEIGIKITNIPSSDNIATCYKPLGEITGTVRFYFEENGETIFLCPKAKLEVVKHPTSSKRHSL